MAASTMMASEDTTVEVAVPKYTRTDKVGLILRQEEKYDAILVHSIDRSSLFAATQLKVGMRVLKVNGVSTNGMSFGKAMRVMRESEDLVTIKAKEHKPRDNKPPSVVYASTVAEASMETTSEDANLVSLNTLSQGEATSGILSAMAAEDSLALQRAAKTKAPSPPKRRARDPDASFCLQSTHMCKADLEPSLVSLLEDRGHPSPKPDPDGVRLTSKREEYKEEEEKTCSVGSRSSHSHQNAFSAMVAEDSLYLKRLSMAASLRREQEEHIKTVSFAKKDSALVSVTATASNPQLQGVGIGLKPSPDGGVMIDSIQKGSPFHETELCSGMIVLAINGYSCSSPFSVKQATRLLRGHTITIVGMCQEERKHPVKNHRGGSSTESSHHPLLCVGDLDDFSIYGYSLDAASCLVEEKKKVRKANFASPRHHGISDITIDDCLVSFSRRKDYSSFHDEEKNESEDGSSIGPPPRPSLRSDVSLGDLPVQRRANTRRQDERQEDGARIFSLPGNEPPPGVPGSGHWGIGRVQAGNNKAKCALAAFMRCAMPTGRKPVERELYCDPNGLVYDIHGCHVGSEASTRFQHKQPATAQRILRLVHEEESSAGCSC